jgi:hypothetical protein
MATTSKRHTVAGSEKQALPGAKSIGAVRPDERIEVTVRLRSRPQPQKSAARGIGEDQHPGQRHYPW